jgi:hypothetical protein
MPARSEGFRKRFKSLVIWSVVAVVLIAVLTAVGDGVDLTWLGTMALTAIMVGLVVLVMWFGVPRAAEWIRSRYGRDDGARP